VEKNQETFTYTYSAQQQEEVQNILNGYTDEQIYERQIAGIRDVMAGKTCFDRIGSMLAAIGSDVKPPKRAVAVLAETITSELKEMFESQTYPDKELFSIADVTEEDIAEYAMVAFFDAAAYYGPFYLEDMVNGFKYTASDYITKAAYHGNDGFISGPEHEYVSIMPDKTHTLFWRSCFTLEQLLSMGKEASLPNGYSIDRFQHSYAPAIKKERRDYRLTVSLPVYNNGRHLCGKAFSSLMRSSMFEDMDIILVDDGSTDGYTPKVVKSLVDRYPNVRSYFFNDGGSGSASRPRNKGDEMAFAPYVTYLDPDNEAIHDGYAKLYKITTEGDYDLVISDMLICNDICVSTAYSKEIMRYSEDGIVSGDKKKFLAGIKFTPMSVQGMIVQKDLIKKNNITSVVGAVGEDSFMSWQLMYYANKICAVKLDTHIYYALVSGSTVNTISKKYFEKLLIMEKARYPWLEQTGLLSSHMKVRFNYYFRYWTLKKLSQTKEHDKEESAKLCYAMYSIYDGDYNGEDALINRFAAMCKEEDYIGAQAYVESVMKKAN